MRAVVQRVNSSSVIIDDRVVGSIDKGILVLLGVFDSDTETDVNYMINKVSNMRIFNSDKTEKSILECNFSALVVSQFTLCADVSKGRRPSFHKSASPTIAEGLFNKFVMGLKNNKINTETGVFGAMMDVQIDNNGPFTLVIDSQEKNE